MKPLIVLTLALLPALANATQITLTNPQEEQTENGKTLCIYENANYTVWVHHILQFLLSRKI
ncbi:Uncharacterised protein [Klebsiella pneumoniae]|uniref:ABC transporter substrate-binding protein n=1 Tax=Klebsiella pneumoniae TaxID=573 RepID=A0A486SRF4_KLEPN|nr:Uncharacterised protein [Klebsiella pneumoniae]VGH40341.1 Uncharacterised protein [Klebsiella pneumoniae]VGH54126.1 Uncharacterised protein [Klebsiella pneumoniae]VGI69833.1 Uncharacterised protein [Klebsiella pneumoniae]VGK03075.1 Uncharacterised protein [Klebsiella pneumoniae]